ncbi:MAG TPA: diaminopimelate epimerase [Candidatus Acidoferrales bacterium]|nr:diaminopimelate epimerase [Candidatus Acidoferrales bacterium]
MIVPFTKMHGAGNDFVVIDHREPFLPLAREALFARWCDRRRGVGADGVLLLERAREADFRFVYHNADGGPADFCGNGARCLARFALERGLGRDGCVTFHTPVGTKRARLQPDGLVALEFGSVANPEPVRIEALGRSFEGALVLAGVPHFVVPVDRVERVPLAEWAPPLRAHPRFGATGTNVDFVTPAPRHVAMRTWERGVEGETLACGSGAIATAAWALGTGRTSPVTIRTAGGDDLVVAFGREGGGLSATLVGPAVVAFTGELALG